MAEPSGHVAPQRLGAGRIVMVVAGALVALIGVGLMGGGALLVWAHATQRDAAGYYTTSTEHFATPTYALTSRVDLGDLPGKRDWVIDHPVAARIRATSRRPVLPPPGPPDRGGELVSASTGGGTEQEVQ